MNEKKSIRVVKGASPENILLNIPQPNLNFTLKKHESIRLQNEIHSDEEEKTELDKKEQIEGLAIKITVSRKFNAVKGIRTPTMEKTEQNFRGSLITRHEESQAA
jgi:hypothetical protein